MSIWKNEISVANPPLDQMNARSANTLTAALGIRFSALGPDWIEATMPVDGRTHQPDGLLHGGASVALAETLGSIGSALCIDREKQTIVGVEINANHLRGARSGIVTGRATPIRLGSRMHVWEIRIRDEANELVCVSRLTVSVLDRRPGPNG
jgi:1,4-dihydroxy-2-naphthoyl-CoA hydrolase